MSKHARSGAPVRRRAGAALLATGLAVTALGFTAVATDAAHAAPSCTIDLSSSDDSPTVGQNITLTWTASGADELVASWTTAKVPFKGSQVTTRPTAGSMSYQVTGLKNGQYCGGAAVNVVFRTSAAPATTSPAATTSAPSSSAPSSPAPTTSAVASPTVAPTSAAVSYPAQSPTGGPTVPWYAQPANLLALGVLSLLGSLALYYRDRVRAVLVRDH